MIISDGRLIYLWNEIPEIRAWQKQFMMLYWAWIASDCPLDVKTFINEGSISCQFQVGIT